MVSNKLGRLKTLGAFLPRRIIQHGDDSPSLWLSQAWTQLQACGDSDATVTIFAPPGLSANIDHTGHLWLDRGRAAIVAPQPLGSSIAPSLLPALAPSA